MYNNQFVQRWLNIIMLFFPLTTFLVLPAVQGTTIITVFSSLLFGLILFLPLGEKRFKIYKELFQFAVVIFVLSVASQMANMSTGLKLPDDIQLINRGDYLDTFYRLSHITQTLYLIVGFLIYILVKYFADWSIMDYIFWGLRLLCIYALYEFFYYLLTGQNGDFITNRTFGYNEKSASLFQTVNLGGISFMRLKGYTGEPSMFTFVVVPYWILSFALKRHFDTLLMFLCLMLTFSTTAYFCVCSFLLFWFLYNRKYKLVLGTFTAIAIIGIMLQMEPFSGVFKGIYEFVFADKLSGDGVSSRSRGGFFQAHISYWANLDFVHKLVGIGFGYIRSTDFFSTLFLNTGLAGFLIFTFFIFKNVSIWIQSRIMYICYVGGLIALYLIMMATVPEFAYPSLWIFLSLGYILQEQTAPDHIQERFSRHNAIA